jgi:hypothetical protein
MAKARKKTKNAAGKSATLAKRDKAKAQFITHAEARRRAERHVINQMFKGATVRDGAEVRLGIYTRSNWTGKDVWVVYKNAGENALKSSEVVLVCKRTGRVLYAGSACDEG